MVAVLLLLALVAVAVGIRVRSRALRTELAGLRAIARREELLARYCSEGTLVLEPDDRVREQNAALRAVLGYSDADLRGTAVAELVHPDDATALTRTGRVKARLRHRDGSWLHVEMTRRDDGADGRPVLIVRNITEQHELERRLQHDAFRDALTGLGNRVALLDRLRIALGRRERRGGRVAVLFLDLDDFKTVNDSLGHAAGDELLVGTADRLRASLGPGVAAARLGGDEFAVVLENVDAPGAAGAVAQRVLDALREPFAIAGSELRVPCSIGIALSGQAQGRDEPEALLRDADVAMYRAKDRGKRRYEFFSEEMRVGALARLELRDALARAIDRGEFRLHYQPVVDLRSNRVVGVEALVRWQDQLRGLVPPNAFVPLAEETGLMDTIGRWILRTACTQAARWQQRVPGAGALRVNVNFSARQLEQPSLVGEIAEVLAETGLSPQSLVIEITEDVFMHDSSELLVSLLEIRELGVRLAIDDFGTGYSSLSYLQRFPVDYLKIDRSFVEGVDAGRDEPALSRAVIEIAHSLGIEVVAEGIERRTQLSELQRLGCEYGQGFYFAKGLTHNEMEAFLAGWLDPMAAPAPIAATRAGLPSSTPRERLALRG